MTNMRWDKVDAGRRTLGDQNSGTNRAAQGLFGGVRSPARKRTPSCRGIRSRFRGDQFYRIFFDTCERKLVTFLHGGIEVICQWGLDASTLPRPHSMPTAHPGGSRFGAATGLDAEGGRVFGLKFGKLSDGRLLLCWGVRLGVTVVLPFTGDGRRGGNAVEGKKKRGLALRVAPRLRVVDARTNKRDLVGNSLILPKGSRLTGVQVGVGSLHR